MAVPVARPGWPGSSRHAAMMLRNGPAANPRAGISRIAHSGQSSCGIARARAASCSGVLSGRAAWGVLVR